MHRFLTFLAAVTLIGLSTITSACTTNPDQTINRVVIGLSTRSLCKSCLCRWVQT